MAFNSTDWTIDYTGSTVTNNDSGTGTNLPSIFGDYTYVGEILEFYQWLAFEFASGDTMQYSYPINSVTPTVYEWINDWGFGDKDNDYKYLKGGSITGSGATLLYSNLYSLGTQTEGSQLYIIQDDEELIPWWITGNIDILVKVKDGTFIQSEDSDGLLTDGAVWVYSREFGDVFDHNFINLSAGGRSPISINTAQDGNNISGEIYLSVASATGFLADNFIKGTTSTAVAKIKKISINDIYLNSVNGVFQTSETITEYSDRETKNATGQSTTNDAATAFSPVMTTFDDITITFGSTTKDLNNGSGLRPYEVVIDCKTHSLSDVYEFLKYVVRYRSSGATYQIQSDDGQEYRNASGTTWTDLKVSPFATFAGGKFFGARGVWIENMAGGDIQNYQLIDSENILQSPPEEYSLTLTDIIEYSEIRIYTGKTATSNQGEVAGIENVSGTTFSYQYSYTEDFTVDIVVLKIQYEYYLISDFPLTNSDGV